MSIAANINDCPKRRQDDTLNICLCPRVCAAPAPGILEAYRTRWAAPDLRPANHDSRALRIIQNLDLQVMRPLQSSLVGHRAHTRPRQLAATLVGKRKFGPSHTASVHPYRSALPRNCITRERASSVSAYQAALVRRLGVRRADRLRCSRAAPIEAHLAPETVHANTGARVTE